MGQTVQQRGGDNARTSFMTFGQDLKQKLRRLFGKGHVSQLIKHQKAVVDIPLQHPPKRPFILRFQELIGQPAAGHIAGAHSLAAGGHSQRSNQDSKT
jgi:hypothetical protein